MKSLLLLIGLLPSFIAFGQGNSLPSVTIGEQIWTSTNLSVSTFRNGDEIPQSKSKDEWYKAGYREEPTWCYYDFDERYKFLGKLYNYYAVASEKNIAPNGWRVPDFPDYIDLILFLDPLLLIGDNDWNGSLAGGALKKDMSNEEWNLPTGILKFNSSNECPQIKSGFNAIPSGGYTPSLHGSEYDWKEVGTTTYLWCLTDWMEVWDRFLEEHLSQEDQRNLLESLRAGKQNDQAIAWRILNWDKQWDYRCVIHADDDPKLNGYSVRLIKE